jgi:hypothetical protein
VRGRETGCTRGGRGRGRARGGGRRECTWERVPDCGREGRRVRVRERKHERGRGEGEGVQAQVLAAARAGG